MVQRYIEIPEAEVATCMHEHYAGDWVKYEDYAALELRMIAALSHMERADKGGTYGLMSGYIRMAIQQLEGEK